MSHQTLNVTLSGERELVITREFDAPRQLVFDAWTRPEILPRWMLGPAGWSMPVCEIDLRPGGSWHFVWRRKDGESETEMEMRGVYREVVPPERLVSTESWGADWPEVLNTLVLAERGGRTMMTMTLLYPSREAREAALKTGMAKGLELSYKRLDEHLAALGGAAAVNSNGAPA